MQLCLLCRYAGYIKNNYQKYSQYLSRKITGGIPYSLKKNARILIRDDISSFIILAPRFMENEPQSGKQNNITAFLSIPKVVC